MFLGLLFLAIGAILVIQNVFNIDLPIIRICFGLLLIYWGLQVVFGSFGMKVRGFQVNSKSTTHEAVFSNSKFKIRNDEGSMNSSFTTAFGSSQIDLSNLTPEEMEKEIKIENAFGQTHIKTNGVVPLIVKVSSGFSNVQIRGQAMGMFGDNSFQSENFKTDAPHLKLKIETGFGKVIID